MPLLGLHVFFFFLKIKLFATKIKGKPNFHVFSVWLHSHIYKIIESIVKNVNQIRHKCRTNVTSCLKGLRHIFFPLQWQSFLPSKRWEIFRHLHNAFVPKKELERKEKKAEYYHPTKLVSYQSSLCDIVYTITSTPYLNPLLVCLYSPHSYMCDSPLYKQH